MSDRNILAACRMPLLMVGIFSFFANLLMLTVPLYMLQLFDRVLASRSEETLLMLTVVAAGALVVLGILELVRSRVLVRIAIWLPRALGPALLSHAVQSAVLSNQGSSAQGLRDLATLRGFLGGSGIFHLFDAPWVPIYVAVTFLLHPWLGALAAFGAILLFGIALLNELATRKPLSAANALSIRLFGRTEANLRNAEAIEAMGMLPGLLAGWTRDNEAVLRLHGGASDRAGTISALARFVRPAVQIAILAVGVYLAIRAEITPGAMIAASIILSRALAPVEQLIGTWKSFVGARAAYGRIKARLARPPVVRGETRLPIPQGRLDVERVTLVPPGGSRPALQDLNFRLAPGECLGVVGPSAAGKSSLARLLVGIWPASEGTARLDGADLFTWNREDLGRHIGYLPQDVELFNGTVKQNIARMGQADDEAVIAAAQLAGVHEMVLGLPLGYDTVIGDEGVRLSGGQRQRLALARAFYGDPRLLVLDEPNANLDAEGEKALTAALAHARDAGVTSVVIAHRLGTLAAVDKLLVLSGGRVAMFGEREAVLARIAPIPKRAVNLQHESGVAALQQRTPG